MALRETDSSLCLSSTFKVSLRHMSSWVATVVYSGIVSFYDLLYIQSQANVMQMFPLIEPPLYCGLSSPGSTAGFKGSH